MTTADAKLRLRKETLRVLVPRQLQVVIGGTTEGSGGSDCCPATEEGYTCEVSDCLPCPDLPEG